jgi:hypothetical protein
MEKFLELVRAERLKQINKHGHTPEYDDDHVDGEIADAAACYANTINSNEELILYWPWEPEYFKKEEKTRKDQIITACAMLMAEHERLERLEAKND